MTRKQKDAYIAVHKQRLIEDTGCYRCNTGMQPEEGFGRYWRDDYDPYDPRRFVFKYTEPRDSDVPVSKLSRYKTTTQKTIDDALARCVILCRSCADPRRTRKEVTQCQKRTTTNNSPPSS